MWTLYTYMCMCYITQNNGDEKTVTLDFLGYSYENSSSAACNRDMIPAKYYEYLPFFFEPKIYQPYLLLQRDYRSFHINWTCAGEYDGQSADERERGLRAFDDILPTKPMDVIIRKGQQNVSIFKMIQQYREFIDLIMKRNHKEKDDTEELDTALK